MGFPKSHFRVCWFLSVGALRCHSDYDYNNGDSDDDNDDNDDKNDKVQYLHSTGVLL